MGGMRADLKLKKLEPGAGGGRFGQQAEGRGWEPQPAGELAQSKT